MTRALIVQGIVPHYRIPLFRRLCEAKNVEVTLAYGEAVPGHSLQTAPDAASLRHLRLTNVYLGPGNRFLFQKGLLAAVKDGRFDAIVLSFDLRHLSNYAVLALARRRGTPVIWWGHGIGPDAAWVSRLVRLGLCRLADAVIFYDHARADQFIRWGLPREKVFVAENSIDTTPIRRVAKAWGEGERYRVLYVGRLIREKRIDDLVLAFAESETCRSGGTRLTIIGDGPERAGLEALAQSAGIADRVDFAGSITDQESLAGYFNSARVSVSPGNIGLSAIHSLAYGVPVLVSRHEPHGPEVSALVDGVNCVFYEPSGPSPLAEALDRFLSDDSALQSMSEAGVRTVANRYSIEAMAKTFEQAIGSVLQRRALAKGGG